MAPKESMKCYYEVLGVSRDAGDDDLKKQYRRLALKYHPDKNLDNIESATEQFRYVQQAYEVLIDPQERAWYDKHREAILKGGCGFSDNYKDECFNLMQYFTASCYTGFGNNENGFYAVYRGVFETLSKEEYEYIEDYDSDDPDTHLQQFGDAETQEKDFLDFYSRWTAFCTQRSYVWMEQYDTREAPNRRVRRLMEAENKKLRDVARKERNDEVRELVAFVKKRDPRVKAYRKKLEDRADEVKKQTQERKVKDQEERQKKLENYQESEWSAMSSIEKDLKQLEAGYDQQFGEILYEDVSGDELDGDDERRVINEEEDDADVYYDDLFCVACNKSFKTEKAFVNHENSKKHRERMSALKLEMQEDELKHFHSDSDNQDSKVEPVRTATDPGAGMEGETGDPGDEGIEAGGEDDERLVESDDDNDHCSEAPNSKLSKQQKKRKKQQRPRYESSNSIGGDVKEAESPSTNRDEEIENEKPADKKKKKSRRRAPQSADNENQDDDVIVNGDVIGNSDVTTVDEAVIIAAMSRLKADIDTDENLSIKERGNKRKKENKRVVKPEISESTSLTTCAVCDLEFSSKSQLFNHLKTTGHAVAPAQLTQQTADIAKGKSKRKGKR